MSDKHLFFKLVFPNIDPNLLITPEAEIHARSDGTYRRLTHKLTESQFDTCIEQLIDELEHIRQEAKNKFAAAKNKLHRK